MQFKVACVSQGTTQLAAYCNLHLKSQSTTDHWDYAEYHISPTIGRVFFFQILLCRKQGPTYFGALQNIYEEDDYEEL
jgi:hypothetical protein